MVVAAFDNEREFRACMEGVQAEIRRRREAGEPVDSQPLNVTVARVTHGCWRADLLKSG